MWRLRGQRDHASSVHRIGKLRAHAARYKAHDSSQYWHREPAPRTRRRHLDLLYPARRTAHPRHPRVQVRLVLEKVQVPPALRRRAVRLAPRLPALRTPERPAPLEVQVQVQSTRLAVELRPLYPPRKPQRRSNSSTSLTSRLTPVPPRLSRLREGGRCPGAFTSAAGPVALRHQVPQITPQLPTQNSEEPKNFLGQGR